MLGRVLAGLLLLGAAPVLAQTKEPGRIGIWSATPPNSLTDTGNAVAPGNLAVTGQLRIGGRRISQGVTTPMDYGCTGDGNANDTACVQAAIDGAAAAGMPLYFDSRHLYNITAQLNITQPMLLEGPFRYAGWRLNEPSDPAMQKCPWGLVTKNTGITMINAAAVTGTIRGLCIDMTGSITVQPTQGAAIMVKPADYDSYSAGWHIEQNTILNPWDGIDVPGNGVDTACCGKGQLSNGAFFSRNTISNPAHDGISVGRNSATGASPQAVGITVTDNVIICGKWGVSRGHAGVALYEGGIWYDGTQVGPNGCTYGTLVSPGVLGGTEQAVQLSADGVFGDQSVLGDLVIQPRGGRINYVGIGGKQPWAAANEAYNTMTIDCTNSSLCENFTMSNMTIHGGFGNNPVINIKAGMHGPINLTITGSNICKSGNPGNAATGILLDIPAGVTAGRWVITGNQIGNGCLGSGTAYGINLALGAGGIGHAVTITGNDMSGVSQRALNYTPNPGGGDEVVIESNNGVNNRVAAVASAGTITLDANASMFSVGGNTTISTINGAWSGRHAVLSAGTNELNTDTVGNICAPAVTGAATLAIQWFPGGTCWTHVP